MSRSVPYVSFICFFFFFFNDPATTAIYTLSLHDALPIFPLLICALIAEPPARPCSASKLLVTTLTASSDSRDRKSTRLNSSHSQISYAVFCLKKKKKKYKVTTHHTQQYHIHESEHKTVIP